VGGGGAEKTAEGGKSASVSVSLSAVSSQEYAPLPPPRPSNDFLNKIRSKNRAENVAKLEQEKEKAKSEEPVVHDPRAQILKLLAANKRIDEEVKEKEVEEEEVKEEVEEEVEEEKEEKVGVDLKVDVGKPTTPSKKAGTPMKKGAAGTPKALTPSRRKALTPSMLQPTWKV